MSSRPSRGGGDSLDTLSQTPAPIAVQDFISGIPDEYLSVLHHSPRRRTWNAGTQCDLELEHNDLENADPVYRHGLRIVSLSSLACIAMVYASDQATAGEVRQALQKSVYQGGAIVLAGLNDPDGAEAEDPQGYDGSMFEMDEDAGMPAPIRVRKRFRCHVCGHIQIVDAAEACGCQPSFRVIHGHPRRVCSCVGITIPICVLLLLLLLLLLPSERGCRCIYNGLYDIKCRCATRMVYR